VWNILIDFFRMHNAEWSLTISNQRTTPVSISVRQIVCIRPKYYLFYGGLLYLNLPSLLNEYFCLAAEVFKEWTCVLILLLVFLIMYNKIINFNQD
jgi:hypothetical protein